MEMHRFKTYLLLGVLLVSAATMAQQQEFIFGQLVDATQNDPIPFATIRIKGKALGVISNMNGTFKIPLRYKEQGEVLEISCLGYETRELHIDELDAFKSSGIKLTPSAFELAEAIVSAREKKVNVKEIVRTAVNNIPMNYPENEFNLVGYYRDYQVKNNAYVNLNEAIIKVRDEGFDSENSFYNQYQLLSYTSNKDFEIDRFAAQPYDYKGHNKIVPNAKMKNDGGNEFILLGMHDPIRNYKEPSFSFINDLRNDFVNTHSFKMLGKSKHKNESVYQIEIAYSNDHYRAQGLIFINTTDFSIHKLDYELHKLDNETDEEKENTDLRVIVNASERFSDGFRKMDSELLYRIQTEYTRGPERKMYLNYISFYNKILVQRPPRFESKFVIYLDDFSFRIRLNKMPAKLNRVKKKDFKVRYKKELIPIEEFYFLEDELTFVVCPDLDDLQTGKLFENFNYEVADVTHAYELVDDEGNKLNERKWEYLHQYREFFTQDTEPNAVWINKRDQMIRLLPLDSPEQPISNEAVDEYWKNTPLQGKMN